MKVPRKMGSISLPRREKAELIYKVKEKREKLKMSQAELIKLTGISRATISLLENGGTVDIKVSTLDALAKALKCSPGDIFMSEESTIVD